MALISDLPNATPQKSDLMEIQNGQTSSNNSTVGQLMQLSASENLAPAYDPNAGVYAVGDFVTQNGTLYQCNTAIATPEAFDATKWTAVKVTEITSGAEVFTLSFPSTITDLYIKYQNCYYCPITDEVHIAFAIYSASGKIPVQNAVFATIPEKYRPTVERNSGYAIVIPSSSGQYAPHIESINNVGTNGRLSLGNWLWGSTTTQILIVDFSYIR